MECKDCRLVLDADSAKDRAESLDALQRGEFFCESCPSSSGPGIVQDHEQLDFVLFDPQQVFEDGTVRPTALMQIDVGGLSTLRDSADDSELLNTVRQMQAKNDGRVLYGIAVFSVSNVRFHEGERLVGVYDTPLEGKPNHVDIIAPILGRDAEIGPSISKNKRKLMIKKRLELLNGKIGPVIPKAEYRGGLLNGTPAGFGN